jgi:hypothetical protein
MQLCKTLIIANGGTNYLRDANNSNDVINCWRDANYYNDVINYLRDANDGTNYSRDADDVTNYSRYAINVINYSSDAIDVTNYSRDADVHSVRSENAELIFVGYDQKFWNQNFESWGRCYDHNFLRFLTIFGEKIGVFLENQCYDQNFA